MKNVLDAINKKDLSAKLHEEVQRGVNTSSTATQQQMTGITVGAEGRSPDQHKVDIIQPLPLLTSETALCPFLGLIKRVFGGNSR
ncbi:uncharacterized protein LOC135358767 [Latimeria chalumnae]|uniref:uncharacterized protein LOC135358767 n=1 Tax=Latimeria chalumnae TaxID=7897 RepID=UPI00313E88E3